jgi:RNA polymerase sigma factor (sigma-70 family)
MQDSRAQWIAEALVRYELPLVRFATKLLRDAERARDVVQETFLQLCSEDRASVEGHLAAWLFRVCRNRVLDLRRKENRVDSIENVDIDAANPRPGPAEVVRQHEETSAVLRVLESLPESQQEAICLRFQAGLSYKEISEVTGHSVGNVGFLLHAAVKTIREQLENEDKERPLARVAEGSR